MSKNWNFELCLILGSGFRVLVSCLIHYDNGWPICEGLSVSACQVALFETEVILGTRTDAGPVFSSLWI